MEKTSHDEYDDGNDNHDYGDDGNYDENDVPKS